MTPSRALCLSVLLAALSGSIAATSQNGSAAAPKAPRYNPLETFAPFVFPDPVNTFRSANGAPGPQYWQNRADYELHARLDVAAKTLTGSEIIVYTNNSPDTLLSLWLHLEQNTYRRDSRGAAYSSDRGERDESGYTNGFLLDSVELQSMGAAHARPVAAHNVVSDTRVQIQMPEAMALVHGAKIRILIQYHYTVPGAFGGRTAWGMAKQGPIFDIAQWYPRMCVYDDLHGWDTLPYLANEFYLEYGNFDYFVTVPSNMIVAGSGELVNPRDVLSKTELERLAQARQSDKTVMIRTAAEAAAAAAQNSRTTKTWHFNMDSTRDAVFTASATYLWDAARINVPAGAGHPAHTALAQSVYPAENAGPDAWGRSTEYLKDAVEHFSARWYPYPYPNAINTSGPADGMEYPGILFDGDERGKELFWVTAHEIGHTWFPMIIGFNERRHAWMDEGFNTFIDTFESDEFNHGEYGPKRDAEYAPNPNIPPADQLAAIIADPDAPPIMARADAIREKYRHPITYFKSAYGLTLLRDDILGPERFDFAFRKFIADWAFKHPSPSDFFRAMESSGGEDLSYFWRGWYVHNWQLDLAVTNLTYDEATKTAHVTVANLDRLVLPANLRVQLVDGSHVDVAVPAETWMQSGDHNFIVPVASRPASATIDPDHMLPDENRANNTFAVRQ